jgi:hypothetical protein
VYVHALLPGRTRVLPAQPHLCPVHAPGIVSRDRLHGGECGRGRVRRGVRYHTVRLPGAQCTARMCVSMPRLVGRRGDPFVLDLTCVLPQHSSRVRRGHSYHTLRHRSLTTVNTVTRVGTVLSWPCVCVCAMMMTWWPRVRVVCVCVLYDVDRAASALSRAAASTTATHAS